MDNYKIKVKDEAVFAEVVALCEQISGKSFPYPNISCDPDLWIFIGPEGAFGWSLDLDHSWSGLDLKELTLPQLRDLVVLRRGDVKDANYKLFISSSQGYLSLYKASDDVFYAYASKSKCWDKSRAVNVNTKDLEPVIDEKDPALISGAEALRALADGKSVEWEDENGVWWSVGAAWTWNQLLNMSGIKSLRLKPQTIKVELEIPAPCKAKIGGRDDASFVLNVGRHQYCYNNEEDYTKARDALESVFDAAVRGTNS